MQRSSSISNQGSVKVSCRMGKPPVPVNCSASPTWDGPFGCIAETNGEAFYRGALAEKIAAFARQHGAVLSESDLAAHTNDWCGTISQEIGGVALHEIPPNGQGIAALMALGIFASSTSAAFILRTLTRFICRSRP